MAVGRWGRKSVAGFRECGGGNVYTGSSAGSGRAHANK
jgi:hypothetical protein